MSKQVETDVKRAGGGGRGGSRTGKAGGYLISLGLLLAPLAAQESGDIAGGVRVPEINEQGVMTSLLTGREVRFRPGQPMEINGLTILSFAPDGKTVNVTTTSPGCLYDTASGVATSDEPIRIEGQNFTITGTGYVYTAAAQSMEIHEEVTVILRNNQLTSPRSASGGAPSPEPVPPAP